MQKSNKNAVLLAIGFNGAGLSELRKALGRSFRLRLWVDGGVGGLKEDTPQEGALAAPRVMLLNPAGLDLWRSLPVRIRRRLDHLPRIMLLDEALAPQELASILDLSLGAGVSCILRLPRMAGRLREHIGRLLDFEDMQECMLRMSRELSVEREILERKNEALHFLSAFLMETSAAADVPGILQAAGQALGRLFCVHCLHALLWERAAERPGRVTLYIDAPERQPAFAVWQQELLLAAKEYSLPARRFRTLSLAGLTRQSEPVPGPREGHLLRLPLSMDGMGPDSAVLDGAAQERGGLGCLLALTEAPLSLGRDQALALNAALRHLALLLNNQRLMRDKTRPGGRFNFETLYPAFDGRQNPPAPRASKAGAFSK